MRSRSPADILQASLRELYAHFDLDALPRIAIGVACQLVPCEVAAYNEIDTVRGRAVGVLLPEDRAVQIFQALPLWERYMHQHPVLTHFQRFPHDRPRKVTDFLKQADFEESDLFREFFGPLDMRYQIVTNLPTRSSLVVGISQNRTSRDFTERERRALDMFRPHLRQAYENASLVSELKATASRLELVMDRIDRGQIAIDNTGRVRSASPAAVRFVAEYLPAEPLTATTLPETLAAWSRREIMALEQAGSRPLAPSPLLIEGQNGRLATRLIRDEHPHRYIIVLSRTARLTSPDTLKSLGLTAREAQVLYWCIEGKTLPEAAAILKISDRTVQKHLEHIYTKMNVTNRVAAVTKALEWVRW